MSQYYCIRCGGNHPVSQHNALLQPDNLPLETPSHNGPYVGTVEVKVLPPGFSYDDGSPCSLGMRDAAKREREKQSAAAQEAAIPCVTCGKLFKRTNRYMKKKHRHCSDRCYKKAYDARAKALKLKNKT